jgi:hypothetical protein
LSKVEEEPGIVVVQNDGARTVDCADVATSTEDSSLIFNFQENFEENISIGKETDSNNDKEVKVPKSILRFKKSPTAATVNFVYTAEEEPEKSPVAKPIGGSMFGDYGLRSMFGGIPSFGYESNNNENKQLSTSPKSNTSSSSGNSPKFSPDPPRRKTRRVSFISDFL